MSKLGDLFKSGGGVKVPSFNTAPLKERVQASLNERRGIAQTLPGKLSPFTQRLEKNIPQLGAGFTQDVGERGQQLIRSTANPALRAAFRQQRSKDAFANVPALQQQIRQELAGGGVLGNAAARSRLADPLLNAARDVSSSTLDFDLAQEQARQDAERSAFGADTGALETELGLNTGLENTLFSTGRGDVLSREGELADLSAEEADVLNQLDIMQQQADIAKAQAAAERRRGLRSALLQAGGQLLMPAITKGVGAGFNALRGAFATPAASQATSAAMNPMADRLTSANRLNLF